MPRVPSISSRGLLRDPAIRAYLTSPGRQETREHPDDLMPSINGSTNSKRSSRRKVKRSQRAESSAKKRSPMVTSPGRRRYCDQDAVNRLEQRPDGLEVRHQTLEARQNKLEEHRKRAFRSVIDAWRRQPQSAQRSLPLCALCALRAL